MGTNPAEQGRTLTRRQLLAEGAGLLGITAFLAACRGQTTPQSPRSQREIGIPTVIPTETATPRPISENERLIRSETQRLGIISNAEEARLWQQFGYKYNKDYQQKFPTPELQIGEAKNRIDGVLTLMYNSKNTYLKKAADDFAQLKSQGFTDYEMLPNALSSGRQTSVMEAGPKIINGRIMGLIQLSATKTLSETDDATLAIYLAHEIEHVRNIFEYDRTLPISLPAEQKLEKHLAKRGDKKEYLAEEARGYAVQAQAYIVEYGFGFSRHADSLEGLAADFIRSGNKNDSPGWLDVIEKYLKAADIIEQLH